MLEYIFPRKLIQCCLSKSTLTWTVVTRSAHKISHGIFYIISGARKGLVQQVSSKIQVGSVSLLTYVLVGVCLFEPST